MSFNPEIHQRRSIRLKDYDYSQDGLYFVTLCTNDKQCLFGHVIDGVMQLNSVGLMLDKWLKEICTKWGCLLITDKVIMPNHVHFIIENYCLQQGGYTNPPLQTPATVSLSKIVQWFKVMTTTEYIRSVKTNNWKPFKTRLWQRNYYEHIIKTENAYILISEYITNNPQNWSNDKFHNSQLMIKG